MVPIPRSAFLLLLGLGATVASASEPTRLNKDLAGDFAKLALKGIDQEYPNKPGEVLRGPEDIMSPRAMHPAFYGCYDWHSSVHGHWLLVRLLRLFPDLPDAANVRARLASHLTPEALAKEAAYWEPKENRNFERMYGWAWALRLAAELKAWDDPDARHWAKAMEPLERKLVELTKNYLPRLTYPVRTGVHPDTAFALGQILDYARVVGETELERVTLARAREYYLADRSYPISYEPSGQDFFSMGLNEADLMRRVLPPAEYSSWLDGFIPTLRNGELGNWGKPPEVSDVTDPQIVHLAGLDLSRAWTLHGVLSALSANDPRRAVLERSMREHEAAGLKYVFSGHYEGEHWLATFAVYHVSNAGTESLKAR